MCSCNVFFYGYFLGIVFGLGASVGICLLWLAKQNTKK